jgi:hypothetical protein
MLTPCLGLTALTAWRLWPEWKKYVAVRSLIRLVEEKEAFERRGKEDGRPDCVVRLADEEIERIRRVVACRNAMESLTLMLEHNDDEVVWNAVEAISQIDLYSLGAVEAYRRVLRHDSAFVRAAAARGMCRHYEDGLDAVPILLELIDHENHSVRSEALFALAYCTPRPKTAVPRIIKALHDRDKFVRAAAAYALCRIDDDSKPTGISVLKELLHDANVAVASESRYLLTEIEPSEVPVPRIGLAN